VWKRKWEKCRCGTHYGVWVVDYWEVLTGKDLFWVGYRASLQRCIFGPRLAQGIRGASEEGIGWATERDLCNLRA